VTRGSFEVARNAPIVNAILGAATNVLGAQPEVIGEPYWMDAALIADVGNYSVGTLARSKRLADDLGYDSLLQLQLLDRLRTAYPQLAEVDVTDLLPRIHYVGDLVDFVVHELARTA